MPLAQALTGFVDKHAWKRRLDPMKVSEIEAVSQARAFSCWHQGDRDDQTARTVIEFGSTRAPMPCGPAGFQSAS